ncbi:unnamed protein product [Blepharisma stoltei]|uniref:Uncharacterized protein n=1 Tax=Blepharisma stoltei TaxID=1481888 RepID=A0AAU9IK36_9CILI|nr:unnamed protein product [Blepharisma stoltei]
MAFQGDHKSRLPHLQRPLYQEAEPLTVKSEMMQQNTVPDTIAERRIQAEQPREARIQVETLPRPLQRHDEFLGQFTAMGQLAPPILDNYIAKEQAVTSPRFLRFTFSQCAIDENTQKTTGLPLAAVWHPLADVGPGEDAISILNKTPFRCNRCLAFINPHFRFVEGGRKCICNICGLVQDNSDEYFNDRDNKPELLAGTYEFVAPSDYSNRPPMAPLFFFCIDISAGSLSTGLPQQILTSIKGILDYITLPERCNIGIMTFDISMQFYKIGPTGEVSEILVTDVEDPFVPENVDGLAYNVAEQREQLDGLLDKLLTWEWTQPTKVNLSAGTIADACKNYLLKGRGGRVLIFTSQLGTVGKYKLTNRVDPKLFNTEKEKLMYAPLESYATLAQECTAEDVCVDIFLCTGQYADVPSLAALCSQTGGDLNYYPSFNASFDGERIYYKIFRILTRTQGFQAVMRARCSNGIAIDQYIGKFKRKGPVEMELSCIDSDKTIAIILKHDSKLQEDIDLHVQCAMLYTNQYGQRLIRIFNGLMRSTKIVPNIFKSGDADTIANVIARINAHSLYEEMLGTIREKWHSSMIQLLTTHRITLETAEMNKILAPENLRLLPLYSNTAMKLPAFSLTGVQLDSRLFSVHDLLGMSIHQSRLLFYPSIYSLHDISYQPHQPGTLNSSELLILPNLVCCSLNSINTNGAYLLFNGEVMLFYIGRNTNEEFLQNVFGISQFDELSENPEYWVLNDLGNDESAKVIAIVDEIRKRAPSAYPTLYWLFEGKGDDFILRRFMVEDATASEMSYSDYLLRLHKIVLNKVAERRG